MIVKVEIQRRNSASEKTRTQTFSVETDAAATVALLLECINEEQAADDPISWECSCKQKKCGACAMLINGRPRLACDARVHDYPKGVIKLAPLGKFPVVRDLTVDRSAMFDALAKLGAWLTESAGADETGTAYDASRCLQCGCCLEVCPNFYAGGEFFGAAALAPASRLISEAGTGDAQRLREAYNAHFYRGCGKSLSCKNICPAGIDTERLLVNSNAAAVWKRKMRKARGKK
ncbi:MAG: succinate dehydrogenase/fumarate reductase iron-sulfur subunit [Ruminiclostridium sp.]|nr:succinate dehydrogenase/fumarate reductase iron-sulfur subunit [Ruminiclostridium sp.]